MTIDDAGHEAKPASIRDPPRRFLFSDGNDFPAGNPDRAADCGTPRSVVDRGAADEQVEHLLWLDPGCAPDLAPFGNLGADEGREFLRSVCHHVAAGRLDLRLDVG